MKNETKKWKKINEEAALSFRGSDDAVGSKEQEKVSFKRRVIRCTCLKNNNNKPLLLLLSYLLTAVTPLFRE